MFPLNQRVPVIGVKEGEVSSPKRHRPRRITDTAPIRCQIWDGRNHLTTLPVTFDEMGHPTDVIHRATSAMRITMLVFVWATKVYEFRLPEPQIVLKGQTFHLALGHMKLLDKFGVDALAAGRK